MPFRKQTVGAGVLCSLTLSAAVLEIPAGAQTSPGLVRLSVPVEDATNPNTVTRSLITTSKVVDEATKATTVTLLAQPQARSRPDVTRTTASEPVALEPAAGQPVTTEPATLEPVTMPALRPAREANRARVSSLDYEMIAPAVATEGDTAQVQEIQLTPALRPAPSPQDFAQLEQRLRNLDVVEPVPFYGGATPGVSSHIPTAYGAYKGDAALGAAYQNRNRGINDDDGAIGAVIGFGSPRTIGAVLGLNIYDLGSLFDNRNTSFGNTASVGLKLHRPLSTDTAVAVGVDDLIRRNPEPLQTPSYYAVVSHRFRLKSGFSEKFSRLYATLGVGNGRYRDIDHIVADKNTVGVFGGLGLMVNERATVFTEWTGQDLNLGVSFVPFRRYPLVVTPAITDLTHQAGNNTRFTLGLAYRLSY